MHSNVCRSVFIFSTFFGLAEQPVLAAVSVPSQPQSSIRTDAPLVCRPPGHELINIWISPAFCKFYEE